VTDAIRLDRIFREVKELVPLDGMELLTPSTVHGVVPQSTLGSRPQQAHRDGYQVAPAQPGDFVISLSSHAHGIEWCGLSGGISPDYTLLRPIIDMRYIGYLKYALKSQYVIGQLGVFKTGVRMGLRLHWNKVRYCEIDLPALKTAVRLADFMDRETTRIDGLIERKTRFIELLREKRQALVTHAVTKGLDPDATMKDSGVEWLGQVPAHWSTSRLRFVALICNSNVDKKSYDGQKTVSMCNYVDVYYNERITPEIAFRKATATQAEIDAFTLRGGDAPRTSATRPRGSATARIACAWCAS
jgi:type I restriction enzyme S subunit